MLIIETKMDIDDRTAMINQSKPMRIGRETDRVAVKTASLLAHDLQMKERESKDTSCEFEIPS